MTTKLLTGSAILVLTVVVLFAGRQAISDEGEDYAEQTESDFAGTDVAPVTNALYKDECGSCHLAYPPGLLPAASWTAIMTGLSDHFGENAEVAPDTEQRLTEYLTSNSADQVRGERSRKVMRSLTHMQAPLRITELPYIVRKHDELSREMVQDNPEVRSLSQCNTCHAKAEEGIFDEDQVVIPGFPNWDD